MVMDREHETDTAMIDKRDQTDKHISKGGANAEADGSKPKRLRRYYCKICGLVRSRRKLLNPHIISQHFEKIGANGEVDGLIGTKRKQEVIAEAKLKIDTEVESKGPKQVDIRRYCCKICGFVRGSRGSLRLHIKSHHFEKISDEEEIEVMINDFDGSKGKDLRRYCCQLCGIVRSKRIYLRSHIVREHSEEIAADEEIEGLIEKKAGEDKIDDLQSKKGAEVVINEFKKMHIRRYDCKICGVVRSKRKLLKLHIIHTHGVEALEEEELFAKEEGDSDKLCPPVCDECGVSFQKPSHFKQHKLTHSVRRPFVCLVDGCLSSYKRQYHLNRHLLKHEGQFFVCPKEDCRLQLSTLSNLKRHLKWHKDKSKTEKKYCCPNCGKCFKYRSKLAKHRDDVHSTTYTQVICCEPGCMKNFINADALREHLRQSHNQVSCEICQKKISKKNLKQHLRIHETKTDKDKSSVKRIKCPYERCLHGYTRKSNLNQHIRAVHLDLRPYKCHFDGCGMTFAYKNVRNNHEMSGAHCYVEGDFLEEDAAFLSRPRGGRKRKSLTIDSLFRKRVACPGESTILDDGSSYMEWLMSNEGV